MSSFAISTTEKIYRCSFSMDLIIQLIEVLIKKAYWKCEFCRTIQYKGRIHTDLNNTNILFENNEHNHQASAVTNEVKLFQEKNRSRAANTTESTQRVIDPCLDNVSDQMVALLPNFKYIKRNIQRQRQNNDLLQIPHDKNFTMIPTPLTVTIRNDKFLQFDSGSGDDRLVIFASNDGLTILSPD